MHTLSCLIKEVDFEECNELRNSFSISYRFIFFVTIHVIS